jgi:hypothetical protein
MFILFSSQNGFLVCSGLWSVCFRSYLLKSLASIFASELPQFDACAASVLRPLATTAAFSSFRLSLSLSTFLANLLFCE